MLRQPGSCSIELTWLCAQEIVSDNDTCASVNQSVRYVQRGGRQALGGHGCIGGMDTTGGDPQRD